MSAKTRKQTLTPDGVSLSIGALTIILATPLS